MAHRGRKNADDTLALALATGQTLRDAAAAAGVGERTATRRWADPAFRRRVADLRGDMVQRSLGRLSDGMAEAADVLRQLLKAEADTVKLGAARSLMELGAKLREVVELASKVDELERLLKGDTDDVPGQARKPAARTGAGAGPRTARQGEDAAPEGHGT
jgi:hypothetical protein